MRYGKHVLGIAVFAFILGGCATNGGASKVSEQVRTYSRRYKRERKHSDLRWLAENYLCEGIKRSDVRAIFGERFSRWHITKELPNGTVMMSEPESESIIWIYSGRREVPYGHYLYICFTRPEEDAAVTEWEWMSE
jgi:hypothetical protein